MSKLPNKMRKSLKKEAEELDRLIADESSEHVEKLLDSAEGFTIPRPARRPVSIRLDPFDISIVKRLARRKGIPYTQLMATWLHERIAQEKEVAPN